MDKKFVLDIHEAELKRPKHEAVVSIAEYNDLDIAVSVVDARIDPSKDKTIIWPQAYAARLDQFETQRQVTIAEALNARVIAVESPGVGKSVHAKSSFVQKAELAAAGYRTTAYAMLGAINEVVPFGENEKVDLVLYSQGAAIGSSMLDLLGYEAHGLKLKTPKVTIIEAVNDQPWNLFKLLKQIGVEDMYTDRYLKENEAYDWLVPPTDRTESGKQRVDKLNGKQNLSMLLGGAALRKPFTPVLMRAIDRDRSDNTTGISGSRIDVIKFDLSGVSRLDKNEMTISQLKSAMPLGNVALTEVSGPSSRIYESHHFHPAVHSMPNMNILSREFLA